MRNVSRAFALAALLAAAILVAGACSTFAGPAWQVNDVSMSVDDFYAAYQESLGTSSTTTTTGERIETASLASFMTNEIQKEILAQGLAERGIEVTQQDKDAAESAIQQQAQQQGSTASPSEEQIATQASVVALGTQLVKDEVAAGTFDLEAAARAIFDENAEQLATPPQTCLHVIFVAAGDPTAATGAQPTEAETAQAQATAEAAAARLATEDFAVVSKDVSVVDSQYPGGDIKCQPTSQMDPGLAAIVDPLAVGAISAPSAYQSGFVIARVDSRTTESTPAVFEDFEQEAQTYVVQQKTSELVENWLREHARDADVVVDPRFGSWDAETATVVPPEGPATPTVPTTALAGIDPSSLGGLGLDPTDSAPTGP